MRKTKKPCPKGGSGEGIYYNIRTLESMLVITLYKTNSAMQAISAVTAVLLLAMVLSGCVAVPLRKYADFVVRGTSELATTLLQDFVDTDKNLVFSPFGILALLTVMAEGAHGETRTQLLTTLHLPDDREYTREVYRTILQRINETNPTNQTEFRNVLYVSENVSVEPKYKEILQKNYLTEVKDSASDRVTDDVEETGTVSPKEEETEEPEEIPNSDGMEEEKPEDPVKENPEEITETSVGEEQTLPLEDNVTEPDADYSEQSQQEEDSSKLKPQMYAHNCLHFKDLWKHPFKLSDEKTIFYKSDIEIPNVKMMHTTGAFLYGSIQELDSVALQLPYEEQHSLLVVMPNNRSGLRELTEKLIEYPLSRISKNLEMQDVEVYLPTFNIDIITNGTGFLSKLRVSHIFDPDKADLSGVSKESSGIFVKEFLQLVHIIVDETAGRFMQLAVPKKKSKAQAQIFVADHPFLFFALDNIDKLVIATGKVVDPTDVQDFPQRLTYPM